MVISHGSCGRDVHDILVLGLFVLRSGAFRYIQCTQESQCQLKSNGTGDSAKDVVFRTSITRLIMPRPHGNASVTISRHTAHWHILKWGRSRTGEG
jgi:hypothetical protein